VFDARVTVMLATQASALPDTQTSGGGRRGVDSLERAAREPSRARFLFVVSCHDAKRLVR
jgi:DNA-binding sugar fermentation-stimulating protein